MIALEISWVALIAVFGAYGVKSPLARTTLNKRKVEKKKHTHTQTVIVLQSEFVSCHSSETHFKLETKEIGGFLPNEIVKNYTPSTQPFERECSSLGGPEDNKKTNRIVFRREIDVKHLNQFGACLKHRPNKSALTSLTTDLHSTGALQPGNVFVVVVVAAFEPKTKK